MFRISFFILLIIVALPNNASLYASEEKAYCRTDSGIIEHDDIKEASGIIASRKNNGVLWTHNDSGDTNRIFALDSKGKHIGVFTIEGAVNRDWEDIATGPGPLENNQYIYIGDTGDNLSQYEEKYIYRFIEPAVEPGQAQTDVKIAGAEKITFRYPDGKHDAETLMVDPVSKDIFIVTKRENNVKVFRAPYPQSTSEIITVEEVAVLGLTKVVGGDISPSGQEILLKTYDNIYYWRIGPERNLPEAFKNEPQILPYIKEPQGEAVSWAADGMGYYTVSEELFGLHSHLYFYSRCDVPQQ